MAMPKYAARVDRNQAEIVRALRKAGCDVLFIKKPVDLLVSRAGLNFLLEVKYPGEGGPTPDQVEFFATWRGQKAMVETVDEALRAVGLA